MRTRTILIGSLSAMVWLSFTAYAQQPPAPAVAVKLADLLAEAEQKSPAIRAVGQAVAAKRAHVPQARALPDPQLTVGYMGDPAPFKTQANDQSSYRQFGVMQEIPYPGKRDLRGKIAEKDADAEQWNVEAARRGVRAQVKLAYYELWSVIRELETVEKNKDLLQRIAEITAEKYKVGKGIQQDVLRAQVEVTRLLLRQTVLRQRRATLEAQLNSLLLRPTDAPLGPLEPFEKSALPRSLDELLEAAAAESPDIRRQGQLIEQGHLAVDLARKDYRPDFSVGWDYQNRGSGQRDMYGLQFSVRLPVFYKSKQREAVNEAIATLGSAREMRDSFILTARYRVKEQYLAARASEELLTLYQKGLLPQSSLTLDSSLAAYQVGTLDFLSVLSNFVTILDYETSYYEELANYQKALVRMEEITGLELAK